MRRNILFCLIVVVALASCGRSYNGSGDKATAFTYAKLLKDGGTSSDGHAFTVLDPWQKGKALQTVVAEKPFRRVVVFTTSHCQLLEYLGVADRIVGVCDAKYILIDDIRRRLRLPANAKGRIADCGNSMNPDIERIVALKPDAIILSPYEGISLGRLEKLGIPIIQAADYMETSSLGRAEWMRYYGRLFGCGARADSLFHVVDSTYQSLKAYAAKLPKGRSILTERKTGATWYTPGGQSTIGVTIRDANGGYAFADDKHSGSLALSFEQILAKAGDSDVWAFKYNSGLDASLKNKEERIRNTVSDNGISGERRQETRDSQMLQGNLGDGKQETGDSQMPKDNRQANVSLQSPTSSLQESNHKAQSSKLKAQSSRLKVQSSKLKAQSPMLSRSDLLREFHGYGALKAFRTGEIYECDCSTVPYFEEVSWRPDYLLREMIQLLHPGVRLGGLRYYVKAAM